VTLWLGAVGCLVMGVWEGFEETRDQHKGPGPQCGAVPMGPFYQFLIPKMIVAAAALVTMTIFFFSALVRR
jgi:hypothetical protein